MRLHTVTISSQACDAAPASEDTYRHVQRERARAERERARERPCVRTRAHTYTLAQALVAADKYAEAMHKFNHVVAHDDRVQVVWCALHVYVCSI